MFDGGMSLRRCFFVAALASLTPPVWAQVATLEPSEQQALKIEGFINNVANVMDLGFTPDGRIIVLQQPGDIHIRTRDGMVLRNVAKVPVKNLTATEHGLLGVVAHPDFARNHILFFHASIGATVADKGQVFTATLSDDNKLTFDYEHPIYTYESPEKHNGGMMVINKGYLYMGIGDSGGDATPPQIRYPSCLNKPNGKILRMNLDGSAPDDNPLSSLGMVTGCTTADRLAGGFSMQPPEKRIWAWGFRQPFRFWVDPMTDLVWLGDVGEKAFEEIDVVSKGQHHGYPFEEGTKKYNQAWMPAGGCKGMTPSTDCTPPTYQYTNGAGGDGCALGGFILDGCGWPAAYKDRYLYGDYNAGHLYTLQVTPDRKGIVPNSRKAFGTFRTFNATRMGPDGAVYLMAFDATAIFRVTPKDMPVSCSNAAPAVDAGATPDTGGAGGSVSTGGAGGAVGTGGVQGGDTGGAPGNTGGSKGSTGGSKGSAGGEMGEGAGTPTSKPKSSGCEYGAGASSGTLMVLALLLLRRRRR
jgi:glucose/arabinose dehydrogenase